MSETKISAPAGLSFLARRVAAALLALLPSACFFFAGEEAVSPVIGTWSTPGGDRVTFRADAVVVNPFKGETTVMGKAACNDVFRLSYGRMESAPLIALFPAQPDLAARLKAALVQPIYPVADMACDQGGTTYVLLDEHHLLAIYRDGSVGGMERLTRL